MNEYGYDRGALHDVWQRGFTGKERTGARRLISPTSNQDQ